MAFCIQNVSKSKLERLHFLSRRQLLIWSKVWWQVFLVLIYSLLVNSLHHYYNVTFSMKWSSSLVPILGGVMGLLLVFRINGANDRYYEGRTLWAEMVQAIRILVRSIWTILPDNSGTDLVEKIGVTNFLLAYAVASKHDLREEYGYHYVDLNVLIHHFPQIFSKQRVIEAFKKPGINHTQPSLIPFTFSTMSPFMWRQSRDDRIVVHHQCE